MYEKCQWGEGYTWHRATLNALEAISVLNCENIINLLPWSKKNIFCTRGNSKAVKHINFKLISS